MNDLLVLENCIHAHRHITVICAVATQKMWDTICIVKI